MPNELAAATAAPAEAAPTLPSPFADIQAGTLPAISLHPIKGGKTDPIQEFAVQHFDDLLNAGVDYHEIPETNESVFFNPQKVTPEQIDAAAKAGKLEQIAPRLADLKPQTVEAPLAGQTVDATVPQQPAGPLSGAKVANPALDTARLKNLAPAPKNAPNPVPGLLARRAL